MQENLEATLERHKRKNYTHKLDGDAEARLIAIACGEPPEGRTEWTLRLLADRRAGIGIKVVRL
ncbi:MAG: hypothetical protein JSW66_02380 [Phycisphaerales bacterium]|nr:MAG: hypothetical protein JSW66_02380 [Phycisphaerales bacterium]